MDYHLTQIRVRYSETDQMRVVYHGNYAQYFEIGRVEWLRNKGISYLVFVDMKTGKPISPPQYISDILNRV